MRTRGISSVITGLVATALSAALVAQEQSQFRTAVELVRVDVQVVSGKGLPVLGLGPDRFEVTINGRPRRVVSADLVTYDTARMTAEKPAAKSAPVVRPVLPRRLFMLAVDERSFFAGYADGVLEAARGFIGELQPTDLLGFISYPSNDIVSPTTERAPVLEALKKTVGRRQVPAGTRFNLRPADVISISRRIHEFHAIDVPDEDISRHFPDLSSTLDRICPAPPVGSMALRDCYKYLAQDVEVTFEHLEAEAATSFNVLRGIIGDLGKIEGRKTLVLMSGGMIASDQSGGRPDLGNIGVRMAQEAAVANVGIYTMYVDWRYLQQFAASSKIPPVLENLARDSSINSHWLSEFSDAAGGELFTISSGNGAAAFSRILSESSAYYLLGVAPEEADRDGRPRRLDVKVKQRGVSIRSRQWVVVRDRNATEVATYIPPDVPENEAVLSASPAPSTPTAVAVVPSASPLPAPVPVVPPVAPSDPRGPIVARPPVPAVADSPALPFVLVNAGAYVTQFDRIFANVVTEERYLQTTEAGRSSRPTVPKRESRSDYLLVTLPDGTREWYRDTFDVNGSPIRDRAQRLVDIFTKLDATAVSRANAILRESATYNIGVDRTINLPTLGLVPLQPRMQRRFSFSGGSIDRSLGNPAYLVAFTEVAHPSVIKGTNDGDLLMQGRVWVDVKTGYVLKTELALDDAGVSATISMLYKPDPTFGMAVPVEMHEDYTEADGRRTTATAMYSRFRRFNVETRDTPAEPGR